MKSLKFGGVCYADYAPPSFASSSSIIKQCKIASNAIPKTYKIRVETLKEIIATN